MFFSSLSNFTLAIRAPARNGETKEFEMWLDALENPNVKDDFGRTCLQPS